MSSIFSLLSTFSPDLQPTKDEVERYAQVIAQNDLYSLQPLETLREEAEMQLWITRWAIRESHRPHEAHAGSFDPSLSDIGQV
ncbi:MAG: hypothetical protein KAX37_00110 [Opitutaceae bacterium]|nr:hypothetical protein [Opitutaceae bacterium]